MDKQKADLYITEYLPKIFGFSMKKAFSYHEAQELSSAIVEEVYLSLLKSEEIINPDAYIYRISEHVYSKFVASARRNKGVSVDETVIPFEEDYTRTEAAAEIESLKLSIAYLTKTRREIVYSYYYEDKKISQIAKAMSLSEGTVKWHLNKARNELKEGLNMERKIGKLGIKPIKADSFGHSGNPGPEGRDTEYYLGDVLNLNITYSVYHSPKTKTEIAEELGVSPVFIEDKIAFLEESGFLVPISGGRYTTYVKFSPETYSLEFQEKILKKQLEMADILVKEYVPKVLEAVKNTAEVYLPTGNRELLEAAAVFYGIIHKCRIKIGKDLSRYYIKTPSGGNFVAFVYFDAEQSDPDYEPTLELPGYGACGSMFRESAKYAVSSWSVDTRYSSRKGFWPNNLYTDYEYLYDYINGDLTDRAADDEKMKRLKQREFIGDDGKVNIMMVKGKGEEFFEKIPELSDDIKKLFAQFAIETAQTEAENYPPQMRDLIITWEAEGFIGSTVALMVMDMLYENGTFKRLTQDEMITSNLIMFSDILPAE